MAIRNVFHGGDGRTGYERHLYVSDASDDLLVRYEAMLPRRHFVIPFHFDAATDGWRNYVEMEDEIKTGDSLRTHLIGKHANVKKLVFHNKKPSGVRDPGNPNTITTATKVEVSFVNKAGTPLTGTTAVELDLSKAGTFIIDAAGLIDLQNGDYVETGLFTTENAFVDVKFTAGTATDSCFSAFLDLVDFYDVISCSCAPAPCEVEYPQPGCPPLAINP